LEFATGPLPLFKDMTLMVGQSSSL
jgi:hypothetical protein